MITQVMNGYPAASRGKDQRLAAAVAALPQLIR
jgi:hypothetical protein